ncbi:MAG: nucleoside deaminase [Clostridia bacterium]
MNKFIALAIKEAEEGILKKHGGPFGAVVVKNGQVVGKGHNMVLKNNDPTAHAEISAIRNACKNLNTFNLSGCELYVTAEPCPMCYGAILWANIKKVYYGCNKFDSEKIGFRDNVFYSLTSKDKDNLFEVIDQKECRELFDKYAQMTDCMRY